MRLLPLGVGNSFSSRHYSTCLALEHAGAWLLVECPHPIRKMLREAGAAAGLTLDVGDLAATVVSHLHADHSSGLEGLGYYSHFVLGRRVRLLAHPQVMARVWERLAAGMERLVGLDGHVRTMAFDDYFEATPLDTERPMAIGPFTIESRMTRHHVPTTALRIRAGSGSLGFSADTAWDPELVDWLSAADVILHETGPGIHTPPERLAALPAELRARMRLVHYPDDLADVGIEPLEEGRLLEIT